METITHREYLMRLAYLDEELNRPSRGDNYVMQLIHEVRYLLSKKSKQFTAKPYLLTFGSTKPKKYTKEEQAVRCQQSKARWFGAIFGGKK